MDIALNKVFSTVTLAFSSDACYLPKQENEFIHKIFEDLEILFQGNEQNRVLTFPPLPSRLCDLIQKTVEKYPSLCTFFVGEGRSYRMVVCLSHLRICPEDDHDKGGGAYDQPLGLVTGMQYWKAKCNPMPRTNLKNREPEKGMFLPQALWERDSAMHVASSFSVSEESCSDTTEESLAANQDELSDSSDQVTREHEAFVNLSSSEIRPWPPSWDQPVSYFRAMSWDYLSGDSSSRTVLPIPEPQINGDYISEITANLKERDIVILTAQNDYSCYENLWLDAEAEAFAHILEIYNISPMFKTEDLMDAFADLSVKGLKIHWVDHTHALAVFSSKSAALQALSLTHPLIRVRKLSKGTKKSKGKAVRFAEELQADPKVSNTQRIRVLHW